MILNIILIIFFFLEGIIDRTLGIQLFGYSLYLGLLIYLTLLLIKKDKTIITFCGFFYFLGLGSSSPIIGLLPLAGILTEFLYFGLQKVFLVSNKFINFIYTFVFFILNYLIISFIINQFKLLFSFNLIILLIILGLIGGIISIFSKR